MACNGLKQGPFHLFVHHKWSRRFWKNTFFSPIFLVTKQLIFKAFSTLGGGGAKWFSVGSPHPNHDQ